VAEEDDAMQLDEVSGSDAVKGHIKRRAPEPSSPTSPLSSLSAAEQDELQRKRTRTE